MRKRLLITVLCIVCVLALGVFTACGKPGASPSGSPTSSPSGSPTSSPSPTESPSPHTHSYVLEVAESAHLATAATHTEAAVYYKSCECGANGTDTFTSGTPDLDAHVFDQQAEETEYLKTPAASCTSRAIYYKSCSCGEKGTETFAANPRGHVYDQQNTSRRQFIVSEATCTESSVWLYTCICGAKGTDTFVYGEPHGHDHTDEVTSLEAIHTEATLTTDAEYYYSCTRCGHVSEDETEVFTKAVTNKDTYDYHNLNFSIYTTDELSYGYTWITDEEPVTPVIQIKKGASDEVTSFPAKYTAEVGYFSTALTSATVIYSNKGVAEFDKGETYSYRVFDLGTGTGTDWVEITTVDPDTDTFEFAYVTDSQDHGSYAVAKAVYDRANLGAFQLHGGDIMENSRNQNAWRDLLSHNVFKRTPIMLNAGNHDTTESSYEGVAHMHFNYNMPEQDDTKDYGVYYSFEYGNAKFIVINTNTDIWGDIPDKQYNWILSELQSNTKEWLFVTMHVPMYSSRQGSQSPTHASQMYYREQLGPIFAEYGVDVVFQGHDHAISKSHPIDGNDTAITTDTKETIDEIEYTIDPSGVIYYCGGPSGSQDYGPSEDVTNAPENVGKFDWYNYGNEASWTEIKVEGNKLTIVSKSYETTDVNGNGIGGETIVNRSWGIIKND